MLQSKKKRKPTVIEVKANEEAFRKKQQKRPTIKKARGEKLNKNIMKLYFNGGKKKKNSCSRFCWNYF